MSLNRMRCIRMATALACWGAALMIPVVLKPPELAKQLCEVPGTGINVYAAGTRWLVITPFQTSLASVALYGPQKADTRIIVKEMGFFKAFQYCDDPTRDQSALATVVSAGALRPPVATGILFTKWGSTWVFVLMKSRLQGVLVLCGIALVACDVFSLMRGYRRRARGSCGHCGYDMRYSPSRCPECGCASRKRHPGEPRVRSATHHSAAWASSRTIPTRGPTSSTPTPASPT